MFFFEHHGLEDPLFFRSNILHNQSFPVHLHRAYELIQVIEGELHMQVEQKQYQLAENELAFIFSTQLHSFRAFDDTVISVTIFSPEFIDDFHSRYHNMMPESNVLSLGAPLDFAKLKSVYAKKGQLYTLCDLLLQSTRLQPLEGNLHVEVLQKIFGYVDVHYGEDCSLKSVAAALRYDYSYLSKLFVRATGMHYTEYVNVYRIAQACTLLAAGQCSISEISAICGYGNLRTFHRNFQKIMRCAPTEYAKNL